MGARVVAAPTPDRGFKSSRAPKSFTLKKFCIRKYKKFAMFQSLEENTVRKRLKTAFKILLSSFLQV